MTDPLLDAAPSSAERPCGHGGDRLAAELRAVGLLALDRLDPLLARLRAAMAAPDGPCPVCAALAAVRTDRPDLHGRLAEHASGLAAALRDALAEPTPAPSAPAARRVQHIPVEREPVGTGGSPC